MPNQKGTDILIAVVSGFDNGLIEATIIGRNENLPSKFHENRYIKLKPENGRPLIAMNEPIFAMSGSITRKVKISDELVVEDRNLGELIGPNNFYWSFGNLYNGAWIEITSRYMYMVLQTDLEWDQEEINTNPLWGPGTLLQMGSDDNFSLIKRQLMVRKLENGNIGTDIYFVRRKNEVQDWENCDPPINI